MGYKLDSNILKAEQDLKDKLNLCGIEIIIDDDEEEKKEKDDEDNE